MVYFLSNIKGAFTIHKNEGILLVPPLLRCIFGPRTQRQGVTTCPTGVRVDIPLQPSPGPMIFIRRTDEVLPTRRSKKNFTLNIVEDGSCKHRFQESRGSVGHVDGMPPKPLEGRRRPSVLFGVSWSSDFLHY